MFSFKIVTIFSLIVSNQALSVWHMSMASKHILYDMPVSNNGARCRVIIYKKQLQESDVSIVTPMELGGLKSEEYLKINPQGKMPTLQCTESGFSIPESDTISRYLLSHYAEIGPSFLPDNPKSNILCRFHDLYLASIQGALYKDRPPFSVYGSRKDALNEFCKQLQILDNMVDGNGPFLCGEEVSLSDATIFPTMVFVMHMLPKFDLSHAIPSKLDTWFQGLKENDTVFKRVYTEVRAMNPLELIFNLNLFLSKLCDCIPHCSYFYSYRLCLTCYFMLR
jgi:glutathione S-transferase